MYSLAVVVTMPAGSRRAITTLPTAVSVSRSPARQPSAGAIGHPARGIEQAEPVHHVLRRRRDHRHGGDRQALGRAHPAVGREPPPGRGRG